MFVSSKNNYHETDLSGACVARQSKTAMIIHLICLSLELACCIFLVWAAAFIFLNAAVRGGVWDGNSYEEATLFSCREEVFNATILSEQFVCLTFASFVLTSRLHTTVTLHAHWLDNIILSFHDSLRVTKLYHSQLDQHVDRTDVIRRNRQWMYHRTPW